MYLNTQIFVVYNKLPMGVTDASAKWQKCIEIVLNGIPNVIVNQDDICITGMNDDEHLQTLSSIQETGRIWTQGQCQ